MKIMVSVVSQTAQTNVNVNVATVVGCIAVLSFSLIDSRAAVENGMREHDAV